MLSGNRADKGLNVTFCENRPTSNWSLRQNMENRNHEEKQMTAVNLILTGASSTSNSTWLTVNWKQVRKEVERLQMRVAKAV